MADGATEGGAGRGRPRWRGPRLILGRTPRHGTARSAPAPAPPGGGHPGRRGALSHARARALTLAATLGLVWGLGVAAAQPAVEPGPEEVLRGDPSRPNVALVINVGAGFEPAAGMLDTLAEKGYRATFFVMGWWAETQPDLLRRIADEGHEIASHGHRVFDLTLVSDAAVVADLEAADAAISAATGRTTRPLWSPSAGYRDRRVRGLAAALGYRPILWTLDSGDWTRDATAEGIYERVMARTTNGSIVVLHFDSPTTTHSTAVALPWLIDDLRAAGFRLVTVTELLTATDPEG